MSGAQVVLICLLAAMTYLALACIPWGALTDLAERIASRRAANRRARQIAADTWARHEAEVLDAEMWRRVQRGVVERLKVEATEVER